MLHFFRKIRRDLLANSQPASPAGRFYKYLKYAIGEIILVMIGILLALYVNNQNEIRKERDKFNLALVEVEKEIIDNITWTRGEILALTQKDSVSLEFFVDSVKFQNYSLYISIMSPRIRHQFRNESLGKLSQFSDLTLAQEAIMSEITDLDRNWRQKHFDDFADRFIEIANKRQESFMKYDWYNSWINRSLLSTDESFLDFVLNDPDYVKMASQNFSFHTVYRQNLGIYEQHALTVYEKIYNYLDSLGLKHSDSLLFQYDLNDYKHYLGKYDAIWCSEKNFVFDDSCIVTFENGKLYWNAYRNDKTVNKKEIIPINKYHFLDEYMGLYHLQYDDLGEVEGIRFNQGQDWVYSLEKIH